MTGTQSSRLQRVLVAPHRIAQTLAGLILIAITLVVLASVGSRALTGRPIPSSNELIGSCLMVALVYLSLSSAHHVRITALVSRFPRPVSRWIDGVVVLLSVVGLVAAVWATLLAAVVAFRAHESTVGLHSFPLGPVRLLISVGLALLCLRAISQPREWLREAHEPDAEVDTDDSEESAHRPADARRKKGQR